MTPIFERHFGPRIAVGFADADADADVDRAEDRSRPARGQARHRLIIAATFFATKHFVVVFSLSLSYTHTHIHTHSLSQLSIPIHPP